MAPSREEAVYSRSELSHAPSNAYSLRVPSPPRIVIPPPVVNSGTFPGVDLGRVVSPSQFDMSFLNNVNKDGVGDGNAVMEWKYEKRREAQPVLPFLYLGPMTAARDAAFLQREGITMVLAIRYCNSFQSKLLAGALRVADELGLATDAVDLADNQGLIAAFPRATYAINRHLSDYHETAPLSPTDSVGSVGRVLVFCESGNEKSAGVVAAYLMETYDNVDYFKAMQTCQSQRFCVNFDDDLKNLLCSYWSIITARRDVASAHHSSEQSTLAHQPSISTPNRAPLTNKRSKRNLEEAYENEMTLDDERMEATDHARFERRDYAPFQDPEDFMDEK